MRQITPDMPPDLAQRVAIEESGDLKARFMLLDRAEWLYEHGYKRAACTLIHAIEYLKDRMMYELFPWPKNCVLRTFGDGQKENL